jgi:hypothetical protein
MTSKMFVAGAVALSLSVCIAGTTSAMAECRGTLGLTSCDSPAPNPLPSQPVQPRPVGPDTGGPGRAAPPSGPSVDHHGRSPLQ